MTDNPYRTAAIPGDRPAGPDTYLDRTEAELFKEWKELADARDRVCTIMKKLPSTAGSASSLAIVSGQLAFIDSQMNGILIARAFQRLRAERTK